MYFEWSQDRRTLSVRRYSFNPSTRETESGSVFGFFLLSVTATKELKGRLVLTYSYKGVLFHHSGEDREAGT